MTDLCDRWRFFWFSKAVAGLVQYNASKGEANYLIRYLMDQPDSVLATAMPRDFLNRISWNQMFSSYKEDGIKTMMTRHSLERSGEPKKTARSGPTGSGNTDQVARLDTDVMMIDSSKLSSTCFLEWCASLNAR